MESRYTDHTVTSTNTVAYMYESLSKSVQRVRDLHTRMTKATYCGGCGEVYPCRTRIALDGWASEKENTSNEQD